MQLCISQLVHNVRPPLRGCRRLTCVHSVQQQWQRPPLNLYYAQQLHLHLSPICRAANDESSSSSVGSNSGSNATGPQKPAGSVWGWFDRLPPRVQLGIMGGLLFVGMFVIPFLQPTFLYGANNSSKTAGQPVATEIQHTDPNVRYKLPRYIPVASELYGFLQDNAMPRTGPNGRTESPGVLRIYMASMTILALFYACSAGVSLILKGVAGVLRAMGVAGPSPPSKSQEP